MTWRHRPFGELPGGGNKACLNRAYDGRLAEREKGMERIYSSGPF